MPDDHRTAERRSLALHRRVGERLREDPGLLDRPSARVDAWFLAGGPVSVAHAEAWRRLIDGPIEVLVRRLAEDSERMRELRQDTPFAGVVDERERQHIVRRIG